MGHRRRGRRGVRTMTTLTLAELIRRNMVEALEGVRVSVPGSVETYDASTQRADVKPLIQRRFADGDVQPVPVVVNVPIVWPRSAGASLTFPLRKGDGVLLLFSDRSMDEWLTIGGDPEPADIRSHDLSDAIAIPGLLPFSAEFNPPADADDVVLAFGADQEVRLTAAGGVALRTALGEVTIDKAGSIRAKGPKFAAGSGPIELVAVLIQALELLGTTTTATAIGPQLLAGAPTFTTLAGKLRQIKGKL